MKRVLVLGGKDFAGSNVCEELIKEGFVVKSFSRRNGCDLLDIEKAYETLEHFESDYVVNCAADVGSIGYVDKFAADVLEVNARMVMNVFEIVRDIPGAILINPVGNCGYPGKLDYLEEKRFWNGPVHPTVLGYGTTRRLMLAAAECYRREYGTRSINLITPNMYGPGDSVDPGKTHALNALAIKFVKAVQEGWNTVEVWGSGKPVREWLYVKDFARLARLAIELGGEEWETPVNLGQNYGMSIAELAETIKRLTGYEGEIVFNTEYPDGAARKVMADRRFRERFPGFRFTPLEEGIRETIEHYRKELEFGIANCELENEKSRLWRIKSVY